LLRLTAFPFIFFLTTIFFPLITQDKHLDIAAELQDASFPSEMILHCVEGWQACSLVCKNY
jgi:hypothetical protein